MRIWGQEVKQAEGASADQPPVVFGDMRAFVTIAMAPSSVLTDDVIDRAARDPDIYIALSGHMYYRSTAVESFCGRPAGEAAPLILTRRREIAGDAQ